MLLRFLQIIKRESLVLDVLQKKRSNQRRLMTREEVEMKRITNGLNKEKTSMTSTVFRHL
jgi:hypothetical protein